ncbi:hypothetical protein HG537_0A01090 [Torulaspora globosa]|uniref:Uncharacterized protein n=1 Tax=Torulaspora globosa TaxID=48254 RepID=A0A7H9HNH4_9SACH|nr:hypothetical protein HG537_0A01090 [Torulaspora sp. CBS 2947]
MTTKYVKHVSFDDLVPTLIDDQVEILKHSQKHVGFNNKFLHIPPQYNPLYQGEYGQVKKKQDLFTQDRSGERRRSDEHEKLEKMLQFMSPHQTIRPSFSSPDVVERSGSSSPLAHNRTNHPRLPPPPKVPSLKQCAKRADEPETACDCDIYDMDFATEKKLTKETEKNTQSNSGSRHGYTQAAFANLNELEDRVGSKLKPTAKEANNGRKKSFVGMTDEELTALEKFYQSQSRSTASPTIDCYDFKEQDPFFIGKFDKKGSSQVVDPLAAIYPSRPVVDHRAISITIQHPTYDQYVQDINTKTRSRKPEESLAAIRSVSCYISGRRYTWSSVDWYVENCAQDGDHLIIVTSIPFFEREIESSDYALNRRYFTESQGSEYGNFDEIDRGLRRVSTSSSEASKATTLGQVSKGFRIKAVRDEARQKCVNILNYYASRLQGIVMKITVEMIKCDSPEYAITKAAALYRPEIQIVSTVSTNLQIKFRNGRVKLPFFVMQHYPMSTAVVPYEFIDPRLLGESPTDTTDANKEQEQIPRGDDRLVLIDNLILKSLRNPFAADVTTTKKYEEDNDSLVESVNEYFPIPPEQKRKYELFERMGYIRCLPTRQASYMKNSDPAINEMTTPFSTASNSRRSSRIQYDDGMYKVKSLIIDSDSSDDENDQKRHSSSIRKIRSVGAPVKPGYISPALSPTTSVKKPLFNNTIHPTGTKSPEHASPASESKNKNKKGREKKKTIGSFFRKVFK